MNFYSQELDYNFINRNIQILNTIKTESSSKQKDSSDEKMNKRLFQEAKRIYKNKMPEYASR